MSNILIAGCGDVGIALGLKLAADGHRVYALRRNLGALPSALEGIAADLTDSATLRSLPHADVVYYTAAADGRDEAAYERAYVSGVRNLLQSMKGQGPSTRRFVFVSSTGVYGQDSGEWVDESSPAEPERFSGLKLLEGERLSLEGTIPATVVRFGGIYGPGRERLLRQVREGASCVDDPPRYTNRIHRDDCAGVLRHLYRLDSPAPVYIGVDCDPAAQCTVIEWLARRMNAPAPRRESAPVPGGRGKRCRNDLLLDSGYRFLYPTFREGYARLVDALEASGQSAG
jgi:nucleoside-diphosphate-sugar epimerase